jgi:UDP-N-acetyl-D-mannosaminuronate dehydrogenase
VDPYYLVHKSLEVGYVPELILAGRRINEEIPIYVAHFNHQTQKPEFAEYGILMPVFEVKYKSANEPLEEKEMMWVETIDRLLEDEDLRKRYSEKAKQRAGDFGMKRSFKNGRRF